MIDDIFFRFRSISFKIKLIYYFIILTLYTLLKLYKIQLTPNTIHRKEIQSTHGLELKRGEKSKLCHTSSRKKGFHHHKIYHWNELESLMAIQLKIYLVLLRMFGCLLFQMDYMCDPNNLPCLDSSHSET